MALRFDPVREMDGIREGVRRVFQDSLTKMRKEKGGTELTEWVPLIDMFHDKDVFILSMDLPGVDRKDVEIRLNEDVLTVRGDRKLEKQSQYYLRIESPYGTFERSFTVPDSVDTGKIEAKLEKGVLEIVLPRREEPGPRQVQIAVKE
ncbi:MAG: Hsp20/alpha crystallin family protein [bacterium]